MNDNEIRVAIAEACGWTQIKTKYVSNASVGILVGAHESLNGVIGPVPNYPNDLNAMHEAIMRQAEKDGFGFQALFQFKLQEVVERTRRDLNREQIGWWMNNATARQRAEAFLKTIGKWKD